MTKFRLMPRPGRDFQDVTQSAFQGPQLRRRPSSANVQPTGMADLNRNASDQLKELAHNAGLDPQQFQVTFGVDVEGQLVGIQPAAPGTPGATPVRIRPRRKEVAVHLSGVFQEYPTLALGTRSRCPITLETTSKGVPCLVLSLQGAAAMPRIARKAAPMPESEPASKAEEEAAAAELPQES